MGCVGCAGAGVGDGIVFGWVGPGASVGATAIAAAAAASPTSRASVGRNRWRWIAPRGPLSQSAPSVKVVVPGATPTFVARSSCAVTMWGGYHAKTPDRGPDQRD